MFKLRLFVILAVATLSYAYSGGAPEGTCDDMTPQHPVDPQSSKFPYELHISKKKISPGDTIDITIGKDKVFKGFLLQVRKGDKSVGQFVIPGDHKFAKTLACHSGKAVSTVDEFLITKFDIYICNPEFNGQESTFVVVEFIT